MTGKWEQPLGDNDLVYGMPKHMHAVAGEDEDNAKTGNEKNVYWTVQPSPGACADCLAMVGYYHQVKPKRPHEYCKCENRKHVAKANVIGYLRGYGSTTTESFDAGQSITVEIFNNSTFVAGARIWVDNQVTKHTGWLGPNMTSTFKFSKFGALPVYWKEFMEYNVGDSGMLQYKIKG